MQTITAEIKDSVLWCRLNRPELRNAFNPQMIAELTAIPEMISNEVRAVVLSGEGNVFSAGGDLNWMRQSLNLSREENLDDALKLANMLLALDRLPVPLVGMIHGAAMGGGIGLVSVCDYVIASVDTIFSFSEVKLGIIPACIAPFVLRKIGPGHARALFTTAERFNANKAYDIGLIHQVASNRDELQQLTEKKVQEIKECGPNALRIAKKIIFDLLEPDDNKQLQFVAEILAGVRVSEEGQEGLMAFLEKRKPEWSKTRSRK
ncbi:MAG TPA: enoyl-CoA hydratase-related protein [Acidobacteriota bacterium]|nr:enoyl-CoA hydratase-related protein [Acidobacteriota bacterium]